MLFSPSTTYYQKSKRRITGMGGGVAEKIHLLQNETGKCTVWKDVRQRPFNLPVKLGRKQG